jgi:transcription antitermination factor NusG
VRVTTGPLEGFEGIVIRKSNSLRFVVSLDLIQRSIAVHTEADWLEPL